MQKSGLNRLSYIDVLKVTAAFLIVMLHVSALYVDMKAAPAGELHYFINIFSRIGLPLFIMVSGALLLRSQYRFSFKKKFFYIAKIYAFWSAFYVLFEQASLWATGAPFLTPAEMVVHWIRGPYHFWYLTMLLGIYIFMPVLSRLKDFQTLNYLVVLSFVILYIVQPLMGVMPDCVNTFTLQMMVYRPDYNLFLFLLGAWLHQMPLEKNLLSTASFLFATGLVLTAFGIHRAAHLSDMVTMTPFNMWAQLFMAVGLFYMIRYSARHHHSSERLMLLSKCTLHIFITSAFFIFLYDYLLQDLWDGFLPILGVNIVLWSVVIFALSFGAGYMVYRKDRWLKRRRLEKSGK